jgi:protein involved in polysaccharide export with SLBB domain
MAAKPGKGRRSRKGLLGLLLAALVQAGCTGTGGTQFALFPQRETLSPSAKDLLAASGPHPLPIPRELDLRVLPAYIVEPGDVLIVQPADLDAPIQLPGDQAVGPDGTISLGRYGQVVVAGLTIPQIEQVVRSVIQAQVKDAGPIVARVVSRNSKVFYVLGEVNAPGAYPLQGRETVLDALVAAGGLTDRASRRNILLARPTGPNQCRIVLPVCYRDIVQVGDTTTNYQLVPGDRIFVATRTFWEELFHHKKECPPCGGPQMPCDLSTPHGCHAPAHGPPAAPPPVVLPPAASPAPVSKGGARTTTTAGLALSTPLRSAAPVPSSAVVASSYHAEAPPAHGVRDEKLIPRARLGAPSAR